MSLLPNLLSFLLLVDESAVIVVDKEDPNNNYWEIKFTVSSEKKLWLETVIKWMKGLSIEKAKKK